VELPPGYRVTVEERPSQEDRDVLGLGLAQYNRAFLGETNFARLAIFVRDEATRITAGLDGYAYGGWLFVHYLWVHSDLRRRGIGRGLIAEAERRALVLGCHSAHLDTFSFQAPDFYKKLGYRVFGAIDYPPDHRRFFLQKRLVEDLHADASELKSAELLCGSTPGLPLAMKPEPGSPRRSGRRQNLDCG